MTEDEKDTSPPATTYRTVELTLAALLFALGCVVIADSLRLGASWGDDGPQAGYFPFYIGLIICIASVANLIQALGSGSKGSKPFVHWTQLRMVLAVMAPSIVFVALISNPVYSLGIYEASIIFIAFFMRWLGKYSWPKIAAVSVGVMTVFFLLFEVWFKVPLYKGLFDPLSFLGH